MKLYLLKPREDLVEKDNPWNPWYDKYFGFVVRAETVKKAREYANRDAADENMGTINPWLLSKYSTCKVLKETGKPGVIISDFAAS